MTVCELADSAVLGGEAATLSTTANDKIITTAIKNDLNIPLETSLFYLSIALPRGRNQSKSRFGDEKEEMSRSGPDVFVDIFHDFLSGGPGKKYLGDAFSF